MVKARLLVITFLLFSNAAYAAGGHIDVPIQDVNAPAIIKADSMHYDPQTKRVEAEGNVEVNQGQRILLADKIVYDQAADMVQAAGNVSILEPSGQVYFADKVQLTDDMKTGVVKNFRARLADQSLFAANAARKVSDNVTVLERAVYSPCKVCRQHPEEAPFWQIKADKVKIDEKKQQVSYRNASMDLFGWPVLYSPYFSHPTPGADNKSGFLPPTYGSINTLGATLEVPYYFSLAPDKDITFSPMFTSDEGPVWKGEYRQLTETGKYRLRGSITDPSKRDGLGNPTAGHEVRGHVEGEGHFNLEDNWAWGFAGKRASDDTYLSRYKLGFEDSLTSTAYINQIHGRNFIGARGLTFQGLNAQDDPSTTPFVLPLTETHLETAPDSHGAHWALDTNTMVLYRSEGAQSRRLSVTGGYQYPIITRGGHLIELDARLRGDVYSVENTGAADEDTLPTRLIPEIEAKWSYPMIRQFTSGHMTVEPQINLVASPRGGNPDSIPNEDSQNFELNDINLFSANKFTGLDRLEDGPRANYGVRTSYTTNSNRTVGVLVGQSYRTNASNQLYNGSGLQDNVSNYVGRFDASDNKWLDFAYSFRLSQNDYRFERSEISTQLNLEPVILSVDYIFLNSDQYSLTPDDREEVSTTARYKIDEQWQLTGNVVRGLGQGDQNGGLISSGLGVLFQNECIGFTTTLNREYTRDRDIQPSSSITFQVLLKNLN